jgi:hypothetical protein
VLVVMSVLLTGALSGALTRDPSPTTGMVVALVGTLLALTVTQASRIMMALGRTTNLGGGPARRAQTGAIAPAAPRASEGVASDRRRGEVSR